MIHLIRHAKAGSRSAWAGNDVLRPLSAKGEAQAEGLADDLADRQIERVLSSPAERCVQTVEPLARQLALEVERCEALGEGRPLGPVLDLLHGLEAEAVLCAHGDLIPAAVEHLTVEGMVLDGPARCQKGSVWTLERQGDRFVAGRYRPPPRR